MSNTTTETTITTLEKIRGEWVKNGKKMPTKKELQELTNSLTQARAIRTKAEKSLEDAEANISKVYMELAKAVGCQSIRLDGVIYEFSSRGEKVFLKSARSSSIVDL